MEPWEELLISSTGDDKPMTSPLHIFFLNEKLCHHVTTSFNAGKWLSHKEGGIGHLLVFSAMGDLGGHRARILLSICTRYSRPVLSDLPTYLFIHFLQPARRRPPSAGGHAVWGMWLRRGTWAAETESLLHFLKCQVSVTGFGFKTLSTKVCPWTLKWRCSWIHREWYHSYWQPSVHIKDRCISTCQVKTNKSIALYQVGWHTTPLPFVITGIPFPGPPEKDIHSSKINKDHLSNTGHENIQTPTRWQLKCVLGL